MSSVVPDRPGASNPDFRGEIRLVRGDITQQAGIDAIVAAIGTDLVAEGSLNQTIFAAAGRQFDEFILENIYKPRAGDVFSVPGFNLSTPQVIYAVTPVWRTGFDREDRDLLRCYRHVMQFAHRMGLQAIAFPALGTGHEGFPPVRAARLAVQGIREREQGTLREIRIVCNRDDTYKAFADRLAQT